MEDQNFAWLRCRKGYFLPEEGKETLPGGQIAWKNCKTSQNSHPWKYHSSWTLLEPWQQKYGNLQSNVSRFMYLWALKKKVCLWYWLQNLGNQDNLGYITMMYIPVQVSSNYANLSKVSKNSDQLAHFLPRPSVCLAKSKPLCVAGAISNHIILLFISIFSVGVTLPLLQSPSSRQ